MEPRVTFGELALYVVFFIAGAEVGVVLGLFIWA